jgi:hypothetical protein
MLLQDIVGITKIVLNKEVLINEIHSHTLSLVGARLYKLFLLTY